MNLVVCLRHRSGPVSPHSFSNRGEGRRSAARRRRTTCNDRQQFLAAAFNDVLKTIAQRRRPQFDSRDPLLHPFRVDAGLAAIGRGARHPGRDALHPVGRSRIGLFAGRRRRTRPATLPCEPPPTAIRFGSSFHLAAFKRTNCTAPAGVPGHVRNGRSHPLFFQPRRSSFASARQSPRISL